MPHDILVLATLLDRQQAGAAQATLAIINALAMMPGVRVTLYAWTCDRSLIHPDVQLVQGEEPPPPKRGLWRFRSLFELGAAARDLQRRTLPDAMFAYTQNTVLGLAFRRVQPQIPIVSHTGAVIASRDIMEEERELPYPYRKISALTADRLERASYRHTRWCHIVSTRLVAQQRSAHFRLPEDFFVVCPYGVDRAKFDPSAATEDVRASLDIPSDAVVVASVARLVPWKSIDWLIRAVSKNANNMHLIVVGDGPAAKALQQESARGAAAHRIHFVGYQNPAPYLAASDIFALPSSIESFGMVYAEAMLMELPCVGRRNHPPDVLSSAEDVIPEGKAGFCVSTEDELAARLQQLAEDPDLRRRMGRFGSNLARTEYSTEHYIATLAEIARTRLGLNDPFA